MATKNPNRIKQVFSITLSTEAIEGLKRIAGERGYTWGGNPSPSRLIEAIGTDKEPLASKNGSNKNVIALLEKCIDILRGV